MDLFDYLAVVIIAFIIGLVGFAAFKNTSSIPKQGESTLAGQIKWVKINNRTSCYIYNGTISCVRN